MTDAERMPTLLSLDDVATISRCSRRTIERWVRLGVLPVVRRGRWVRVLPEDVLSFLNASRVGVDADVE